MLVYNEDVKRSRFGVKQILLVGVLAAGVTWGTTQLLGAIQKGKSTTNGEVTLVKRKKRSVLCSVRDDEAPEIVLEGGETRVLKLGEEYEEEGARVEDNCDEDVEVIREGEVNVKVAGVYEVKYTAKDRAGNENVKMKTVRVINPADGDRVVYLTFDDGPGEYTGRLLDILAKYGVKVTFFVTGRGEDDLIKREFEEGHTVALHSYSHNYAYIYANAENYFADLYAIQDRVQGITGVQPTLIRFPGGSSNTISARYDGGTRIMSFLSGEVERRGFSYADWNVSSGDAGGASSAEEVFENVVNRWGEGQYVVLQHDVKEFSVDAVERIVIYGLENGYTFLPMNNDSFLAHHGVNN